MRLPTLLLFAVTSCGVADFDVTQDVPPQTIDGAPLGAVLGGLFDFPLTIDIQSQIEAQDTGPIDCIVLSSLTLDITTPNDDWGFLDRADLFVTSTKPGTELPRVKVAFAVAPGAVTRITFTPIDVNLQPYIDEGAELTTEAEGSAPPDDVTFQGTAVFRVSPL